MTFLVSASPVTFLRAPPRFSSARAPEPVLARFAPAWHYRRKRQHSNGPAGILPCALAVLAEARKMVEAIQAHKADVAARAEKWRAEHEQ